MTTNIATTKEQSARLLQCGVSPESADMCYQFIDECFNNTDNPICSTPKEQYATVSGYGFGDHRIHITPAWSLSALPRLHPENKRERWRSSINLTVSTISVVNAILHIRFMDMA